MAIKSEIWERVKAEIDYYDAVPGQQAPAHVGDRVGLLRRLGVADEILQMLVDADALSPNVKYNRTLLIVKRAREYFQTFEKQT